MARRRGDGTLAACYELASKLPWWVGTLTAIVTWAVFRSIATMDVPIDPSPDRLTTHFAWHFFKPMANVLQYVVPAVLLAGATASIIGRRRRAGLVRSVASEQAISALRAMSWQDFELLVGEVFRLRGYTVIERGGAGPDGGIDLELMKKGERHLVQCKHWRAFKVSVSVVRELFGVMAAHDAAGGAVVTSGVFTAEAKAFAEGRGIELIDGPALVALVGRLPRNATTTPDIADEGPAPQPTAGGTSSPRCPRCGNAMIRRVARQGTHAGKPFWGCVDYPACRGTRNTD
jgi:restriction system protein